MHTTIVATPDRWSEIKVPYKLFQLILGVSFLKNNNNEKNTYWLLWEYLKRNEEFEFFCEWMRELKNNQNAVIKKKIKNSANMSFAYCIFGDIYTESFETWWNLWIKRDKRKQLVRDTICDFPEILKHKIEFTIQHLTLGYSEYMEKTEPSLKDFLKPILYWLEEEKKGRLIISVNVIGESVEDLSKKFKELVKKKKLALKSMKDELPHSVVTFDINNPLEILDKNEIDAYKRNLGIYDLRSSGMKWVDIFLKQIDQDQDQLTKYNNSSKCVKRDFFNDQRPDLLKRFKKAKEIIDGIGKGFFPLGCKYNIFQCQSFELMFADLPVNFLRRFAQLQAGVAANEEGKSK